METIINIAIDGPCGAGKSTIAKQVAAELGYTYLDTGAMYRAIALKAVRLGLDINSSDAIVPILKSTKIDIVYYSGVQNILLDGENVSAEIRQHEMSKAASDISKIKEVRIFLVEMQRQIANSKNVVVDGRDIGSYVLPKANLKIYLTAKSEIRAKRRFDELTAKGEKAIYEEILKDVNDRDYNDMTRDFAPLMMCDDSVELDTSDMSIEQVVFKIKDLASKI